MTGLVALLVPAIVVLALWAFSARIARQVEQHVPPVGQFMDVPGARLHYVDQGITASDSVPIVMIHGLGAHLHHFRFALVEDLARDTRVIAVDRPGSGYSVREPGRAVLLTHQADAIIALLDRLGIARALFVGHSLGGALSLTLALRHPSRVAGLALIAPLTHFTGRIPPVFRALAIRGRLLRRFIAHVLAAPGFLLTRKRVLPLVFKPEPIPRDYRTRGGGLLTLRPTQYLGASEDLGGIPAVLPQIESQYDRFNGEDAPPVHVLFGRGDHVLDYRAHGERFAARVSRCRLELIEGGHMLPLTQAARCARFIRDALMATRTEGQHA